MRLPALSLAHTLTTARFHVLTGVRGQRGGPGRDRRDVAIFQRVLQGPARDLDFGSRLGGLGSSWRRAHGGPCTMGGWGMDEGWEGWGGGRLGRGCAPL